MSKAVRFLTILAILVSLATPVVTFARPGLPAPAPETAPADPALAEAPVSVTLDTLSPVAATSAFTVTVMHTNDFHGQLEASGSNPGVARVAAVINGVRTAVGKDNTLLLDAGDEMQGSLLSNLKKGEPTIAAFNLEGYRAATFGNHEFDWGQTVLAARTTQAQYPFVASNLVIKDTTDCSTAGWTSPAFAKPWVMETVGVAPNQVKVGIIGVTTQETPFITLAGNTDGLCFKDPAASIEHYYADIQAAGANVIVVLSHLGYTDGGYGYGFTVYGDQTLAQKLATDGKPVSLIIGGHSHTNLTTATIPTGTSTLVTQAYYNGRKVGRADLGFDPATGKVKIVWQSLAVSTTGAEDPAVKALVTTYTSDPAYQALIKQVIGFTNVALTRDYNGDNMMSNFLQDAVYNALNTDGNATNDVDMVYNNAGGIRSDIVSSSYPYTLTYGTMFTVLPFGNQTVVGTMTGAQIMELMNQSASLFKGALQVSGIQYKFYMYTDTLPGPQPYAWGAFDVKVKDKVSNTWVNLDPTKTYKVATNEFLAPAGGDGFTAFKYMKNITYWGDMLDVVDGYVTAHFGTKAAAYNGPNGDGQLDGRITRDGNAAGGSIIPLTVLHHNDSHGRLVPTTALDSKGNTLYYQGYTQLATLIKQERAHNPTRNILLNGGDSIQGDSMEYYFKSAGLGYAADGTPLPTSLQVNPFIAAMNAMNYTAMTLGNHEFNFGRDVFTSTFKAANFPVLQANLSDNGDYGIAKVNVQPSTNVTLDNIKVAILGLGNHRVPNYELPSNIPGLTFSNPINTAASLVPDLRANNDVVIALTHIGFTTNPKSVEVDNNVDTYLAAQVPGLDAIVGSHSHTDPSKGEGAYKYLPTFVVGPNGSYVLVSQAYRYNTYLGEMVLGLRPKQGGGYEVVTRAGRAISVVAAATNATPEDPAVKAILAPYVQKQNQYNATYVGSTSVPIDTLKAFTEETNGANLQADASVWELAKHGVQVDFHLSGAMTNKKVADTATVLNPTALTVADMFGAMPYENSLLALRMNGPQLKAVLERAYRNYYYYKYVPGYGGYSYYTTCMIDTNAIGRIAYKDTYPTLPDGNNVLSLVINGKPVDFADAAKYYVVSTVNYLAAGSCNFNDNGVSLWPLNQIVADTQYYVRDAVIDYLAYKGKIAPIIEGRIQFPKLASVGTAGVTEVYTDTTGMDTTVEIPSGAVTQTFTLAFSPMSTSINSQTFAFAGHAFSLDAYQNGSLVTGFTFAKPVTITIHYTDAEVLSLNENALKLYFWDGSQWSDAACGAYDRHPATNTFSVPICHLTRFAVFTTPLTYLPFSAKNAH